MSENIFIPAILGFLYLLLFNSKKIKWILAGLLFGISLLCRPILFSFIPFLIIWLLIFKRKAFIIFIPAIIVLVAAGLINQKVGTHHIFSIGTNGGVNFAMTQCRFKKLQYNGPNKEFFYFTPPAFWNGKYEEKYTSVSFTTQGYYYKMGIDCLLKNPARLFTNLEYIKNIFISRFYPDFPKIKIHTFQLAFWRYAGIIFYVLFILYAFTKVKKTVLPIYLLFVFLFVSLMMSVYFANPGEERYLAGYFFILDLFAVPALIFFIKRLSFN